jgi:cleavage stimulation factor subunit 3
VKYKSSVSKLKEKKLLREGLLINMLGIFISILTKAIPFGGSIKEEEQKLIWMKLIDFEERNTQKLNLSDVYKHVSFAYSQCLLCFYHYPEIWYNYSQFYSKHNLMNEASDIFEKSITSLPDNLLLHLAYSSFEENRKNFEKAKEIFERLIQNRKDSLSFIQYQHFLRRTEVYSNFLIYLFRDLILQEIFLCKQENHQIVPITFMLLLLSWNGHKTMI